LSVDDTLLERLAQDLQDMAAELGPCIQQAHAVVGPRPLPGSGTWPPPISLMFEIV
jgi:hypothetical protein